MANALNRHQIAWRAAQDLEDGTYVNLGIGIPVLAANYPREGIEVIFQSENGILGVGPLATEEESDPDLVDAGSQRVTLNPGAAIVDSSGAFSMIRGGHIDLTLLGGFEVAENGDFANWDPMAGGRGQLVGGAMDLAVGAKRVRLTMSYTTRDGSPRLLERCRLPVTACGVVDRVYTDLAVIDVTDEGFVVREIIDGLDASELQAKTGARIRIADDCTRLDPPAL
jgi:3-oxoacid CoA-transferase B subunit